MPPGYDPQGEAYLLGIDVGTGSARAGLFTRDGELVATGKHDIALWREGADIAEQSSNDIWSAVCKAVRGAVEKAGIDPGLVAGLGFDATCSGVVLGEGGKPLPAGTSGDPERNIIVWMDHRAIALSEKARQGSKNLSETVLLARGLHVVPEFLGNRAPFADPHARAVIAGLSMERDVASLVALYIAGVCGLGYGLRQILETQDAAGVRVERIMISGGAGQDPLGRQILADATRRPMLASRVDEPVLLGSAILGAVAAGLYPDIVTAMQAMSGVSATYTPAAGVINAVHESRYRAFLSLQKAARDIRTSEAGRKVE